MNDEVFTLPMTGVRPVEREFDLLSLGKRFGRKIGEVDSQPRIVGPCILDRAPIIGTPVNDGRRQRLDTQ